VVDCDGDPLTDPSSFDPDTMLAMEVRRYLRSSDSATSRVQTGVNRFRGRQGLI
jgi:hypothetical protein